MELEQCYIKNLLQDVIVRKGSVKVIEPEWIQGLICNVSLDFDTIGGKKDHVVWIKPVNDVYSGVIASWKQLYLQNNDKILVVGTDWASQTAIENWIIEIL
jgi:hypothetical protein